MPVEYFDIYDESGRALGLSKPRDQVHRDGDWHRSIALWIVRQSGTIVFQQRSLLKDTDPGLFTASVSGHYSAGETLPDVLREAREEVGIAVALHHLVPLGAWRHDLLARDRELQDVFLWPIELPLGNFVPDPAEVLGLAEAPVHDFMALLDGTAPSITTSWRDAESGELHSLTLRLADFVPVHAYHRWVAHAAMTYLATRLNGREHSSA